MAKFTNITAGDKGIYSKDGLVMVPAGQVFDGDLAEGETPNEEWFGKGDKTAALEAEAADPLDHDLNGKKGGAAKPAE